METSRRGAPPPAEAPRGAARPAPASGRGAGSPVVRVEGLSKSYPRRRSWSEMLRRPWGGSRQTVLHDVSFEVRSREFFGLLGPNGAGKTTLFKILSTLVAPDGGRAVVAGHDVVAEEAAVRRVLAPVIADERSLYWRLSARENLELFGALHGLDGAEAGRRIDGLLETVGLEGAGRKIVGEYSSGMRQRLLLARALLPGPEVLLLDEPTRSLDPLAAREFRTFLQEEIAGRLGCTVLLATHDSDEALELCDRVGVLDQGRLLEVGPADELARRYAGERYRAWVRTVDPGELDRLAGQGVLRGWEAGPADADGWRRLDLELAGGLDDAAALVSRLVEAGFTVGRFERRAVPLADLLERIVEASGGRAAAAEGMAEATDRRTEPSEAPGADR